MADPFVAEIRIFPFGYAPKGWAFCDGQLLPLSQNTALFSLLGTTYGGDGKSSFGLPDMQGNTPMHPGEGPGLSTHFLGEMSGTTTVTLLETEIPLHPHTVMAAGALGNRTTPQDNAISRPTGSTPFVPASTNPPIVKMAAGVITPSGGSLPHNNMQPFLTLNFCLALQGVYPPRT